MSRKTTSLMLAAFIIVPALLPGPSLAASPEAAEPAPALKQSLPAPTPLPVWGHPTEAVRTASAALHDACVAWPKQVPLASDPASALSGEADEPYESICKLALDPGGFAEVSLLKGLALGAAAAGIALVALKAATLLLLRLVETVNRGMNALWDRRRRRANSWVD